MKTIVEISSFELKTALIGLGKVVNKRATLPVLQSIKITRDNLGIVSLQGTDLDSWATYKLNAAQDGDPVEFLVPMEALVKTAKSTKDRVVLYPEGKDSVILQTLVGSTPIEQKVASVNPKEWPQAPLVPGRSVSLNEACRNALKEAWECASEDESRYILNSVFLDVNDPQAHYLVSTDGRILFSANSFRFELGQSVMIPTRKFIGWQGWWTQGPARLALKPGEKAKSDKEADLPGWLQFTTDQWTFTTKQLEGNYPNWKQVIPEATPKTVIRLSESAIATMLELIPRLPGNHEPFYALTLNAAGKGLLLGGQNKGQDKPTSIPIADVTVEGEPVVACLNRHYLDKALRFGLNEIQIVDALSPLLAKADGKRMVIMPIRENAATPVTPQPQPSTQPQPEPINQAPTEEIRPSTPANHVTNERKTTMTKTTNPNPEVKTETADSPMKLAMQQIETIKDTLRSVIHQFSEVIGALKSAEKEKRTTEKEIEAFREKLREIQSVRI